MRITKTQKQVELLKTLGIEVKFINNKDLKATSLNLENFIYIETKKEPYVSVNHSKNGSLYRTNSWKFDNVEFWITVPQFTVQKSDYDTYFIALNKKYLTKEKITTIEEAAKGFDDFKQVKEVDNVFIELNAQNRSMESIEKAVNQANN